MKKLFALLMAIMMIVAIAVPVAAEISPEPRPEYDVNVDKEGDGDASSVPNEDGTVTLVADPKEGSNFIKWEIEGDYELVSGSLTDKTLTIRPKSDINAKAFFTTADGTTDKEDVKVPTPGDKSPQTGTAPMFYAVAMLVTFAGAAYAFKKGSARA